MNSEYVLQNELKTFCSKCNNRVHLLCRHDAKISQVVHPWFYICFDCKHVSQVGVGPVRKVRVR